MVTCRYVGGESSAIGEREFDTIGQRAVLSEKGYREAVLGGAAFIPEKDFERINFTSAELEEHGPVGLRIDPPDDFCNKLALAQRLFMDIRSQMVANDAFTLASISDK